MNKWVVYLSIGLFFFVVPHTLEDFSVGEPQERGIPILAISLVVAFVIAVQSIGLYWIGQGRGRGYLAQAGIGLFWAVASGLAQFPVIISQGSYRSGPVSILLVLGIVVLGASLFVTSIMTWRNINKNSPSHPPT